MEHPHNLFWTGGWDSTFRLLQATIIEKHPVQPIYIISPERRSLHFELKVINHITSELKKRIDPSLIHDIKFSIRSDIPQIPNLRENYNKHNAEMRFGSQVIWLAEFSEYYGYNDIELCYNRYDNAEDTNVKKILLKLIEGQGHSCKMTGYDERVHLLKYYRFPTIHISKREMGEIAKTHGFEDLLNQSWYCHRPLFNKPCGACEPCRIRKELIPETKFQWASWVKKIERKFK